MSYRNKLLGTLIVLNALILSYVAQISHVSAAQVAQWSLHEWAGAILLVVYSGITTWIGFLVQPSESIQRVLPPRPSSPEADKGPL